MGRDQINEAEEMDIEAVLSMWPEDIDCEKPYNIENPKGDQDMLQEVTIVEEPTIVDFQRLIELTNYTDRGSLQLSHLVKHWELQQANAVRLLREEIDILSQQREQVELKKSKILEDFWFEEGEKRPISVLDEAIDMYEVFPRRKRDLRVGNKKVEIEAESDTVGYWKQRAEHLEKLLKASIRRENLLTEKLLGSIKNLEKKSSPVEELSQILRRADNFLHFILINAPVVMGHQDKELRYRFIYNHFPTLQEQDILGKTDVEIFTGGGVKESQEFKREVLEKGLPAKREITFETELFGTKTFLIYVEPVFSKSGETIGINYIGMEVTDQVRKREKMAKIREEIAVQKAKETELNKTIHITEETMRAKQMLATMSHEIRSPLSGVVSMAEILSTTNLDNEQKQLLNLMMSSGDLILQLINDILDLSKVESGVMKLEETKFRPREVVKHVLQTAAASLQKVLILEGRIADDVPFEVIGDVLRVRQILTNLVSNAIKFTHEGKVGINLYVISNPCLEIAEKCPSQTENDQNSEKTRFPEAQVWLCCDVYDTGIGIPENALPSLFKKYMQVSADHARKYGGTGLGLAICKQLVELMGGSLTVSSQVNIGSTFTFVLPYQVLSACDSSDDPDELSEMTDQEVEDETAGFFRFEPRSSGSLLSNNSTRTQKHCPKPKASLTKTTSETTSKKLHPKILLVEDSNVNQVVAKSIIDRLGYSVTIANNGIEAVRAIQRNRYDLVLMDVYMPIMDGLQATRLIRSFEETGNWDEAKKAGIQFTENHFENFLPSKRVPIIAMTASDESESAKCYANGMDSFISKPLSSKKLADSIAKYCR